MKAAITGYLLILYFSFGCAKKELLNANLKSRAFVKIKLVPELPANKENLASFPFTLYCTRNNGKQKIYNSSDLYQGENGNINQVERKFNVKVSGGNYSNGKIFINRNITTQNQNLITIKISGKDKHRFAKDSLAISLPYVEKLSINVDEIQVISPGFKFRPQIFAHYNTGLVQELNKSNAELFKLEIEKKTVSFPFYYEIPSSLLIDKLLCKVIYLPDTNINATLFIPVKYNGSYTFDFIGQQGASGHSGENAWGTSNRNGRDGGTGQDGQKGRPGPRVQVYIKSFKFNNRELLKIKSVSENNIVKLCYIDPVYGKVNVFSIGGKGGDGGRGGSGSSGSDATEKESAGSGGHGGTGGNGGEGGRGGAIKIYVDSSSANYLNNIEAKSLGGEGGNAGEGGRNGHDGTSNKKGAGNLILGLLNIMVTGSGSSGYKGYQGESGPDPEVIHIDSAKLDSLINQSETNGIQDNPILVNPNKVPVLVNPNKVKGPY